MTDIELIRNLAKAHKIQFTEHASKRAFERSIDIMGDIMPALLNGSIIEEYPDDYPYKSFLLSGKTARNIPLHIVCAVADDVLWIITEYFPDNIKWESDFKTRKEKQ